MNEIPLIDLERWFDGSDVERAELAAEVDAHLQRLGFLVVVGHRIDPGVIAACREESHSFFHQHDADKEAVAITPEAYRGWVGAGLESNAATYGVDTPPDLKETFTYGPVDIPDPALSEVAPRWFAPNVWPSSAPALRPAAEAWWRAARGLADELLDIFSLALQLPEPYLRERCAATTASVSLNWYWPGRRDAGADGQFRIGPHTDFGSLTILDRQPGVGGLQVLGEDGEWMDAPVVEGGLVVNTGDMMRRWTNDRWRSNEHRVLPPSALALDEELISLIFFHEPDYDTMIEALPTCTSDAQPARYPPVLAGDYLAEKMDALAVD